jgi:drug/metabolite transporter (DMT)-like permease
VTPRQWAGLGLGIAGVYLVVHGHTEGDAPPIAWAAATVALIGMTIGTLYQKRFGGGIEWRTGFLIQYLAADTLFALAALATETLQVRWTLEFVVAITWLVFGLSLGAIWLLYFLIRHQAAARVLSLFYLTPPITALMAWLMFNEQLSPLALAGMAVCVAGVALVNWRTA